MAKNKKKRADVLNSALYDLLDPYEGWMLSDYKHGGVPPMSQILGRKGLIRKLKKRTGK